MYLSTVMQALSVLLTSISLHQHFDKFYASSVKSLDKLITWLQVMRKTNDVAERAYEVAHSIIRAPEMSNPALWNDIAHMFPDDNMDQSLSTHQQPDSNMYMPWTGMEQGLQEAYGFPGAGYDFYGV
jgi:hypothetical protein